MRRWPLSPAGKVLESLFEADTGRVQRSCGKEVLSMVQDRMDSAWRPRWGCGEHRDQSGLGRGKKGKVPQILWHRWEFGPFFQ